MFSFVFRISSPMLLIALAVFVGAFYIIHLKSLESKLVILGKYLGLTDQLADRSHWPILTLLPNFFPPHKSVILYAFVFSLRNCFYLSGKELTVPHQMSLAGGISLPVFWLAGAGAAVFWVLGESVI